MSPVPGSDAPALSGADHAALAPVPGAEGRVAPGMLCRGAYAVGNRLEVKSGRWFHAKRLADGLECHLRASVEPGESRRARVTDRLKNAPAHGRVQLLEAHDGAERVEIWTAPAGPTLRLWRAERPEVTPRELAELVRQIADAIVALHASGLGHFAVSSDNVHIAGTPEAPRFTLAGFDAIEELVQAELVEIAVDPFSAPPEAAGLFRHASDFALTTWDWWSLGRLVQETVLGHPVARLLPDSVKMCLPSELRAHAEAMLAERNVGVLHAGGVELMEQVDPRVDLLLRGLLTGAPEGRWGEAEVREWTAGASPKERYAQPKRARFFRLNRRGYTAAEAAHVLQGPDHCGDAVRQIFGSDEADTLIAFLRRDAAQKSSLDALRPIFGLAESQAMRGVPQELLREVIAAVALHTLAGGEFRWKGKPVHVTAAEALGDLSRRAQAIEELKAIAAPPVVHLLKRHDHGAATFLEMTVKAAVEAEQLAWQLKLDRLAGDLPISEIWAVAVPPLSHVEATNRRLRESFAQTDDEALQRVFATPHPPNKVLVLLAWTARAPERFRYVTAEELKRRQFEALTAEAAAAARTLFWHRLGRALATGQLLFGRAWCLIAGALGAIALVAVHLPGPRGIAAGLVPLAAFAGLRAFAQRWHARVIAQHDPAAAPWDWRDGPERCGREAARVADAAGLPRVAEAVAERFERANRERAELSKPRKCAPVHGAPWLAVTWGASVASWALVAVLAGVSAWQAWRQPPSLAAHTAAWGPQVEPISEEAMKITWPFKRPLEPPVEVSVRGEFRPTREQAASAQGRGRALVAKFKAETIDALLAIYVPLENDAHAGLLFFDARKGALHSRNGVKINFVPFPRMWMQIGDTWVFFLEK